MLKDYREAIGEYKAEFPEHNIFQILGNSVLIIAAVHYSLAEERKFEVTPRMDSPGAMWDAWSPQELEAELKEILDESS